MEDLKQLTAINVQIFLELKTGFVTKELSDEVLLKTQDRKKRKTNDQKQK